MSTPTIREQASASAGKYVELDRLEWLDQIAMAVEPDSHVGRRILADCRMGATAAPSDRVAVLKSDALAICDMAD